MNEDDHDPDRRWKRATEMLVRARHNATSIPDLSADIRPLDMDGAYELQDHLNARLAETNCGAAIGYKIGCTTGVMQNYMGIPHPCAGRMFAATTHEQHGKYRRSQLCRPGVECEIGVRIGRTMTGPHPFTAEDCVAHVSEVNASIELVDDRWTEFRKVSTPVLVSDNFFAAGCVFGDGAVLSPDEITNLTGRMWINEKQVGQGTAADILGHPFNALAWLANHCQARDQPLAEGELISLGSVVQTQWIERGDRVRIEFARLGSCTLELV